MKLADYPQIIANLEIRTIQLDSNITNLETAIKDIEAEIDEAIAFSGEYKNDAQRKSARIKLLKEHPQYWEKTEELKNFKVERDMENVELCRIRAEFSIMKLEKREAIAKLELKAATSK